MNRSVLIAAGIALAMPFPSQAEDIVLKFWDNQQTESGLSEYQQEAVQSFEAENPGIKVEVTTIPYPEYQQRLLTAVQGGNTPDISTVDQIWVAAFAEAGAIEPLDDLAASAGITADAFFPGAWASAVYNDALWGIPFNVDVWQFSFYNKD
ncbi:MAG: ABC transporter substrate-binding protein, partial [Geminicoccaceae bacterium]